MRRVGLAATLVVLFAAACLGPSWSTLSGKVVRISYSCPPGALCAIPLGGPAAQRTSTVPVPGVSVIAISQPDRHRYAATSGRDGSFSLNLPGGDYDVYAAGAKLSRISMVGYPAEKRYVELNVSYIPMRAAG